MVMGQTTKINHTVYYSGTFFWSKLLHHCLKIPQARTVTATDAAMAQFNPKHIASFQGFSRSASFSMSCCVKVLSRGTREGLLT